MCHILGDMKDTHLHFQWKNVSVRDYDAEKQLWLVSTDERQHDVFDMYRPAKRARRQQEAIEGRRGSIDGRRGSIDYSTSGTSIHDFSLK